MKYLPLIVKHLLRNKRQSVLTTLSIAVAMAVFSVVTSIEPGANKILDDGSSSLRLVCRNKAGLTYFLPEAYRDKIARTPHVQAVVGESWFGGIYRDVSDQFPNAAIDYAQADLVWPDWKVRPGEWAAFKRTRTACLVGNETMRRFHFYIGQQIMLKSPIFSQTATLQIVGVMRSSATPTMLLFRRDYLEELLRRPGLIGIFYVLLDNSKYRSQVIQNIDRQFSNSSAETVTEPERSFYASFLEQYRTLFHFAVVLCAIALLTVIFIAANAAAMSFRERHLEIAVMRTLGFSPPIISALMVSEAIVMALIGGTLGCALTVVALRIAARSTALAVLAAAGLSGSIYTQTLIVAALVGLASAYLPARAAARQNIVDALRR